MYTRPNIAYAVGVLARSGAAPTYNACYCTVHLLQYLSGGREYTLVFGGSKFGYMAMYAIIQELLWVRGLIREIGLIDFPIDGPTSFLVDNKNAIDLANNPETVSGKRKRTLNHVMYLKKKRE